MDRTQSARVLLIIGAIGAFLHLGYYLSFYLALFMGIAVSYSMEVNLFYFYLRSFCLAGGFAGLSLKLERLNDTMQVVLGLLFILFLIMSLLLQIFLTISFRERDLTFSGISLSYFVINVVLLFEAIPLYILLLLYWKSSHLSKFAVVLQVLLVMEHEVNYLIVNIPPVFSVLLHVSQYALFFIWFLQDIQVETESELKSPEIMEKQ